MPVASGTITVPSSPGDVDVLLDGRPQLVIFFGTNFTTEDTLITASGQALFRGYAAPMWDDPSTIFQVGQCVAPAGVAYRHALSAVTALDPTTAAAIFEADCSFLTSGFRLSFTTAAAGGYLVSYVAVWGMDNCAAIGQGPQTVPLGWVANAAIVQGANVDIPFSNPGRSFGSFGSMRTDHGAFAAFACYPGSASAQYFMDLDVTVAFGGPLICGECNGFLGPFMIADWLYAYASGTDFITANAAGVVNAVAFQCDASNNAFSAPGLNVGDIVTINPGFTPNLVLFYTISNEPTGLGIGGRGAMGLGMLTDSDQWACTINGTTYGAWLSRDACVVDQVNTGGAHVARGDIIPNGFTLETTEAGLGNASIIWHAFGFPEGASWMPHIYRRGPVSGRHSA